MKSVTVLVPLLLVGLVFAHTLVRAVLFRPWQVKPIYRFLFVHSSWYRRWMMRRHVAAFRRMTSTLKALPAVVKRATAAMRQAGEVLDRAA